MREDETVQITTEEAALEYDWRGVCYKGAIFPVIKNGHDGPWEEWEQLKE